MIFEIIRYHPIRFGTVFEQALWECSSYPTRNRTPEPLYRRPILSRLLFIFLIFVGPRAHFRHGSSLGFEPISLCWYLFYRVFESFYVKLLFVLNFRIKNISCQKCL